jgi:hypothetical protein
VVSASSKRYNQISDDTVEWEDVYRVIVPHDEEEELTCPILLEPPVVPRITKCGHIYDFVGILRYFRWEETRKCPICNEMVTIEELRPALINRAPPPPVAEETITFELLQRRKQATTPFLMDSAATQDPQASQSLPLVTDIENSKRARLSSAHPVYMMEVMHEEEKIMRQFAVDRAGEGWDPFLEQGLAIIKAQLAVFAAQVPEHERSAVEGSAREVEEPEAAGQVKEQGEEQVVEKQVKDEKKGQDEKQGQDETCNGGVLPLSASWPAIAKKAAPPPAQGGVDGAQQARTKAEEGAKEGAEEWKPSAAAAEWKPSAAAAEWKPSPDTPAALEVTAAGEEAQPGPDAAGDATGDDPNEKRRLELMSLPSKEEQKRLEKEFFFFYQAFSPGAQSSPHVYLHPFNARCLLQNVGGSFMALPPTVKAEIVEVESFILTREARKRYLYLSHLPLFCEVQFCELDLFDGNKPKKKESKSGEGGGRSARSDMGSGGDANADAPVDGGGGTGRGHGGHRYTTLSAATRARFGDEWKSRQADRRRRQRLSAKEDAKMKRQAEIYGKECALDAEARARKEVAYVRHEDLMKMVESGELFAGPRPGEDPAAVGAGVGEEKEGGNDGGWDEGAEGGEEQNWPSFAQIAKNKHARQQQVLDDESAFPTLGAAAAPPPLQQTGFPGLGEKLFPDLGSPGTGKASMQGGNVSTRGAASSKTSAGAAAAAAGSEPDSVAGATAAGGGGAWGAQEGRGEGQTDWQGWEQDAEGNWFKAWDKDVEGNWFKVEAGSEEAGSEDASAAAGSVQAGGGKKKKKKGKKVTLFANATRRY